MMKKIVSVLLALSLLCPFCSALAWKINLPSGIRVIEAESFSNLKSADSVYIPWGTEIIRSKAFANSGIKTIYIPSTVYQIAKDAFAGTNVTIITEPHSYAAEYAAKYGIPVKADAKYPFETEEAEELPFSEDTVLTYHDLEIDLEEKVTITEGMDPQLAELYKVYNESVDEDNTALEACNLEVQNYYFATDSLLGYFSEVSVQEGNNDTSFSLNSLQLTISQQASGILEAGKVTDVSMTDDGQSIILSTDQGASCYLYNAGTDLCLSTSLPAANKKSVIRNDSLSGIVNAINGWTGKVSEFTTRIETLKHFADSSGELIYEAMRKTREGFMNVSKALDHYEDVSIMNKEHIRQVRNLKSAKYAKTMTRLYGMLNWFQKAGKLFGAVGRFIPFLDMPLNLADIADRFGKSNELLEIIRHKHPNINDSIPADRRELAEQMQWKANAAFSLMLFVIILDTAALCSSMVPAAPAFLASRIFILSAIAVSMFADIMYSWVKENDPKLHSAISGFVTDLDSGEPLSGVSVSYPDGSMVQTSNNGHYIAYHLPGEASLTYEKNGWKPAGKSFFVTVGLDAPGDVEMEKQKYGIVTGQIMDEYGEILGAAMAYTDYTYDYTDGGGELKYYLKLPVGTHTICFMKEGYLTVTQTITVEEGEQEHSPVMLPWAYGLRGRVVDDSGSPVAGADVEIYGTDWFRSWPQYSTETDADGCFRYHLEPREDDSAYGIRIKCDGYISEDLYTQYADYGLVINKTKVTDSNVTMINIIGKYCAPVIVSSGYPSWWKDYTDNCIVRGSVTWGKYSIKIDESHNYFYCVSDTPDVVFAGNCELIAGETDTAFHTWNFVRHCSDLRNHDDPVHEFEYEIGPHVREDGLLD